MKIFFGDSVDEMASELRAQGVDAVRLHVLWEAQAQVLRMRTHVTTFHNTQIYEAVVESSASLAGVAKEKLAEFVRDQCEGARQKVAERLRGLQLRPGILQD